jgi:EpsI family protein
MTERARAAQGGVVPRLLIVAAVLLGTAAYLGAVRRPESPLVRSSLAELPLTIGEWQGRPSEPLEADILRVLGVDDHVTRIYQAGDQPPVGLYVGFYASQRQGDTIHSPMNCLPGAGWQPIATSTVSIPTESPSSAIEVNRVVIEKGEARQLVLYWYQGRGRVVANEYLSRAYLVWDAARRNRTDGALVRVISPVARSEHTPDAAERRVLSFAGDLYDKLGPFLPG